jgi:hypothetical protein
MRLVTLTIFFTAASVYHAHAQGCVAIRSTGSNLCTMQHADEQASSTGWQFNAGYRYYESFRHYVGSEEQKQRLEQQSEVINHAYTVDLSIVRQFNNRWSLSLGVPVVANTRSQVAKWDKSRYRTHSFGIGDMRLTLYRWMLDPAKAHKGNFQLGLGLKFATGDYKYQDYFPTTDSTKELRTVDQSIQPGDGGTGISTEINGFYNFTPKAGIYGNAFYLFNPREQNGVPTYRSNTYEAIMSVADQYMARLGFNYGFSGKLHHVSASLGGRLEGIPVHDAIGGSEGFRRPGYIISIEPGITYSATKATYFVSVPAALSRNRTQSVPDRETTAKTGKFTQGDAAFADYVINIGCSFRF